MIENKMQQKRRRQCNGISLHTWSRVSRGPHARSTGSSDKPRPEQMHTEASTAPLRHSSADGVSAWELWRWHNSTRGDRMTKKLKNKTLWGWNCQVLCPCGLSWTYHFYDCNQRLTVRLKCFNRLTLILLSWIVKGCFSQGWRLSSSYSVTIKRAK